MTTRLGQDAMIYTRAAPEGIPATRSSRKLDLGSGMKLDGNYVRADIAGQPEVFCDARALPFADGSFDEVRMHHVLEHIERRDLIAVMNEVHRVLSEGGRADIEVPVFPYWTAIADPTHYSFFVSQTFEYFNVAGGYVDHMQLYGIRPWRLLERRRLSDGQILRVELERAEWPHGNGNGNGVNP